MIPVIDTKLQPAEKRREKFCGFNARFVQALPEFRFHGAAAHGIKQNAHLHAFLRLLHQHIFNAIEQHIIFNDVILDMDEFLCLPDVLYKGVEFLIAVRKNVHVIGIGEHAAGSV